MKVLGVHFETHDCGAALVRDGEIVSVINEERLSHKKHDKRAPVLAIRACLDEAGLAPSDLDIVAFSGLPLPRAYFGYLNWEVRRAFWRHGATFPFRRSPYKLLGFRRLRRSIKKLAKIHEALSGFSGTYRHYAHEHLHVTGAYWTSGMDDPVIVVAEGAGWDRTSCVTVREGNGWREIAHTPWPHSPGLFYDCVTALAGFGQFHAGKITGLAACGDPSKCRDLVRPLLAHKDMRFVAHPDIFRWVLNPPAEVMAHNREDLSAAFQERLEEVVVDLVATAVERTGRDQVALAGGTFANVKLNQRIRALDSVREIFVHPGMSDIGQALGAALEAYAETDAQFQPSRLDHVYFGPRYDTAAVQAALREADLPFEHHKDGIEKVVAQKIHEGAVVGRFAGGMEYGPRSLGNRSIVYAPTDPAVNDWLNERLERSEFMPFAPAATWENRHRLFQGLDGAEYTAQFMTITCDCTDETKRVAPAIVHVDGTARPHLVRRETNPSFHRLLSEYEAISGIPCLINTSFNMHEDPIVCTPKDGITGFLRSRLDFLAIEDCLVPLPEELRVPRPG
ncbi:MAG: carbamoyltransferase C-terminal domain-containing protein [Planctomycetota bacterium]